MNTNVEVTNRSSFHDKKRDSFAGMDLEELAQDTNILKIMLDEMSSLKKVGLNNDQFQCNITTYLNDAIKDFLFANSRTTQNQIFPPNANNNGYLDIHCEIKSDILSDFALGNV